MIVAASSAISAEAAARVAHEGGNAVDAAVAASLMSMATDVGMVDPSAGALITICPPGGDPLVVDGFAEIPGREHEPTDARQGGELVRMAYGGGTLTYSGAGSVATPGALAGLDRASAGWGARPWADLMAPTVEALERGFPLSEPSANYLSFSRDLVFGRSDEGRALLHHADGRPRAAGEPLRNPALAATFERLAAEGVGWLYGGELGERVVAALSGAGRLGLSDLRAYEAHVCEPLEIALGDWRVATVPLPAVGGVALAALALATRDLGTPGGAADRILAAQRAVFEYRDGTLEQALDPSAAAARLLDAAAAEDLAGLGGGGSPSTTHASAVDTDGLACAITISSGYGSGLVVPGTGMWLNNMIGEVELLPPGPAPLVPGTRLRSNMAPTVARRADGAVLAIGSPGASRITTAISQVLVRFLAGAGSGDGDLAAAIAHPRLHVERFEGELRAACEPGLVFEHPELALRPFRGPHMYFGGVQAALLTADGRLEAAADPRREGAVARAGG